MGFKNSIKNTTLIDIIKYLLSYGAYITCGLVFIASWYIELSWPVNYLSTLTLIISALFPKFSLAALMLALPVFGNRPGSIQALAFVTITATLILGLGLNRLLLSKSDKLSTHTSYPIFLASICGLVSFFSLIALPPDIVWQEIKTLIDFSSVNTFFTSFNFLLLTSEHLVAYSFLSVFLTFQALILMQHVFEFAAKSKSYSKYLAGAILGGLIISLIFGLLDYYQIIDLSGLRTLDPIVNPGDIQFRLQSFFAHSGWFAEYITLAIPFSMLLLLLPLSFFIRISLILIVLLAGEFVLILTYQRGGWLSYPLTLLAVWAAIYIVYCLEKNKMAVTAALKKSALKVLISLPITLAISLSLIYGLSSGKDNLLGNYLERFKGIQKTSDRTDFIVAGYLIGLEHPILGGGSESFAYRFEQEFENPSGNHYQKFNLPLHGSAHNVYAQTFSGKGLLGLVSLLSIFAALIFYLRFAIGQNELLLQQRIIILMGATFAVAFLIYGNVQEIFYVQALQVLVFVIVGLSAAQVSDKYLVVAPNVVSTITKILGLAVFLHLSWEYIFPEKITNFKNHYANQGCYRPELINTTQTGPTQTNTAQTFQWCRKRAFLHVETLELLPGKHFIELGLAAPNPKQQITTIHIHSPHFSTQQIKLHPGQRQQISIPLTTGATTGAPQHFTIPIQIISDTYFIPGQHWANNEDLRPLSFQLFLQETNL